MGAEVEGLVDAGLPAGDGQRAVGEEERHLPRAPRAVHVRPDVVVLGPAPLLAPLLAAVGGRRRRGAGAGAGGVHLDGGDGDDAGADGDEGDRGEDQLLHPQVHRLLQGVPLRPQGWGAPDPVEERGIDRLRGLR